MENILKMETLLEEMDDKNATCREKQRQSLTRP
jgi:hypothetical protein